MAYLTVYGSSDKQLRALFDRFRGGDAVPLEVLEEAGLVRPSPDKVLRAVARYAPGCAEAQLVLEPADAAAALVLRHGLRKTPSMDALKGLVRSA